MPWTPEKIEQLKAMATAPGASWTAQEMADALGTSRNAIIGKIARLKLALPRASGPTGRRKLVLNPEPSLIPVKPQPSLRAIPLRKPEEARLPDGVQPSRPVRETPPRATPAPPPAGTGYFKTCQWYLGDPKAGDFSQCTTGTYGASPYCEHHYHRAYTPRPLKGALPK